MCYTHHFQIHHVQIIMVKWPLNYVFLIALVLFFSANIICNLLFSFISFPHRLLFWRRCIYASMNECGCLGKNVCVFACSFVVVVVCVYPVCFTVYILCVYIAFFMCLLCVFTVFAYCVCYVSLLYVYPVFIVYVYFVLTVYTVCTFYVCLLCVYCVCLLCVLSVCSPCVSVWVYCVCVRWILSGSRLCWWYLTRKSLLFSCREFIDRFGPLVLTLFSASSSVLLSVTQNHLALHQTSLSATSCVTILCKLLKLFRFWQCLIAMTWSRRSRIFAVTFPRWALWLVVSVLPMPKYFPA